MKTDTQNYELSLEHKQSNIDIKQKEKETNQNAKHTAKEDETNFIQYISQYPKNCCHYCKRKLFPNEEKKHFSHSEHTTILCGKCNSSLLRKDVPALAYQNKLDPGHIPMELLNLNIMEKRLISQIHLFVTIVTLPGGQEKKVRLYTFPLIYQNSGRIYPFLLQNQM